MKSLKDVDFDFFSKLEGDEFSGKCPDGKDITLKLEKVIKEKPVEEKLSKELGLRAQPFALEFVGERDSLPRQCSLGLTHKDAGEIESFFLVATRQTNEKLYLCAVFT